MFRRCLSPAYLPVLCSILWSLEEMIVAVPFRVDPLTSLVLGTLARYDFITVESAISLQSKASPEKAWPHHYFVGINMNKCVESRLMTQSKVVVVGCFLGFPPTPISYALDQVYLSLWSGWVSEPGNQKVVGYSWYPCRQQAHLALQVIIVAPKI